MSLTPERQANVESGKIDILYHIVENSQSYVEQIIVQGNNRTKDKVIRRELLVAPGQIYDSVRARCQQAAPRESPVLREGRHLAPGHHRAQSQEHGRHRRGKNAPVPSPSAPASARSIACSASSKSRRATSISSTSPTSPVAAKSSACAPVRSRAAGCRSRVQGTLVPRAAPLPRLQSLLSQRDLSLRLLQRAELRRVRQPGQGLRPVLERLDHLHAAGIRPLRLPE